MNRRSPSYEDGEITSSLPRTKRSALLTVIMASRELCRRCPPLVRRGCSSRRRSWGRIHHGRLLGRHRICRHLLGLGRCRALRKTRCRLRRGCEATLLRRCIGLGRRSSCRGRRRVLGRCQPARCARSRCHRRSSCRRGRKLSRRGRGISRKHIVLGNRRLLVIAIFVLARVQQAEALDDLFLRAVRGQIVGAIFVIVPVLALLDADKHRHDQTVQNSRDRLS